MTNGWVQPGWVQPGWVVGAGGTEGGIRTAGAVVLPQGVLSSRSVAQDALSAALPTEAKLSSLGRSEGGLQSIVRPK